MTGEFYVDALGGRVLLRTAAGDDPSGDEVVLAGPSELLRLEGTAAAPVKGVTFSNVSFAHTAVETAPLLAGASGQSGDFLRAAAVHVRYAEGVVLEGCSLSGTGGYAFWAEEGARGAALRRCAASDLGGGAVRLGSSADVTSTGHEVVDCVLADGGKVWQEGCGVLAQKVSDVSIRHNEIARFRYTGVSTGWTWGYGPTIVSNVTTSFNHLHDFGLGYLSDMGCVYTLGPSPDPNPALRCIDASGIRWRSQAVAQRPHLIILSLNRPPAGLCRGKQLLSRRAELQLRWVGVLHRRGLARPNLLCQCGRANQVRRPPPALRDRQPPHQ